MGYLLIGGEIAAPARPVIIVLNGPDRRKVDLERLHRKGKSGF